MPNIHITVKTWLILNSLRLTCPNIQIYTYPTIYRWRRTCRETDFRVVRVTCEILSSHKEVYTIFISTWVRDEQNKLWCQIYRGFWGSLINSEKNYLRQQITLPHESISFFFSFWFNYLYFHNIRETIHSLSIGVLSYYSMVNHWGFKSVRGLHDSMSSLS